MVRWRSGNATVCKTVIAPVRFWHAPQKKNQRLKIKYQRYNTNLESRNILLLVLIFNFLVFNLTKEGGQDGNARVLKTRERKL